MSASGAQAATSPAGEEIGPACFLAFILSQLDLVCDLEEGTEQGGAVVVGQLDKAGLLHEANQLVARESTGSVRGVADEVRARLMENERALTRLVGQARTQREQRQVVWTAALIGAVLGWLAWHPLAVVLPWSGGNWLVSTLIGSGPWVAGETLMRKASPAGWDRPARLSQACVPERSTVECEAALAGHGVQPTGPGAIRAACAGGAARQGWARAIEAGEREWTMPNPEILLHA